MKTDRTQRADTTFDQVVQEALRPTLDQTLAHLDGVAKELKVAINGTTSEVGDAVKALRETIGDAAADGLEADEKRIGALSADLLMVLEQTRASSEDRVDRMHADLVSTLAEMRTAISGLGGQVSHEADVAAQRQSAVESRLETSSTGLDQAVVALTRRTDSRLAELSAGLRWQRTMLIGLSSLVVLLAVLVVITAIVR